MDGLRCYAPNPESSILNEWPFITENSNFTVSKIFSRHVLVMVLKTSLTNICWEPILSKKMAMVSTMTEQSIDVFSHQAAMNNRRLGDSFRLDPLNRSNALIDLDNDGWDANRDGIISVDAARSEEALAVGEQLSTLEEYFVHLDDGNMVKSGMRSVELGANAYTNMCYLQRLLGRFQF